MTPKTIALVPLHTTSLPWMWIGIILAFATLTLQNQ